MSCKLYSGGKGETAEWQPMPWDAASHPAQRADPRNAGPKGQASGNTDEMAAKLAALDQKVREAREAGRAEGESQFRRAAQGEVDALLQKLASAIHEISEMRSRLRDDAEADLVRLAIAIARKIVGRELNVDPEAITGLVKVALEKMRVQELLRVRVNPEHTGRIGECLKRFGATQAEVIADPNVERGGVLFETSRGNFDASAETQLREIERGLADRVRGQIR